MGEKELKTRLSHRETSLQMMSKQSLRPLGRTLGTLRNFDETSPYGLSAHCVYASWEQFVLSTLCPLPEVSME